MGALSRELGSRGRADAVVQASAPEPCPESSDDSAEVAALRSELAALGAAKSSLLFLGDASQATAAMQSPEEIARSLVELPQEQDVVVATLSEVVRSTKRIVAGAAAFQLEAGRKAETSTHGASAGPPLVARIFTVAKGDDSGEIYAREVVEALAAIRRQLVDLEDLDDRVAVGGRPRRRGADSSLVVLRGARPPSRTRRAGLFDMGNPRWGKAP